MTNPSASSVLGKFIWYDQMSNDLPGAEKFYSKVVGWTIAPNTMNAQRYSLLQAGETMVGGLMPIPEEAAKMGARPAWMGYIAVDDVKAYADKVKAAGDARALLYLYDGAGHGFNCDQRASYNPQSAALARTRTLDFLARYIGGVVA